MRNYTYSKGFSLLELMVVVAIIGILAAIAIPNYQKYVYKSKAANVSSVAQEGMLELTSYMQRTGDNDCINVVSRLRQVGSNTADFAEHPAVNMLDWYRGGAAIRGVGTYWGCMVEVDLKPSVMGNVAYNVVYVANVNNNTGRITWLCSYWSPGAFNRYSDLIDNCPFLDGWARLN